MEFFQSSAYCFHICHLFLSPRYKLISHIYSPLFLASILSLRSQLLIFCLHRNSLFLSSLQLYWNWISGFRYEDGSCLQSNLEHSCLSSLSAKCQWKEPSQSQFLLVHLSNPCRIQKVGFQRKIFSQIAYLPGHSPSPSQCWFQTKQNLHCLLCNQLKPDFDSFNTDLCLKLGLLH